MDKPHTTLSPVTNVLLICAWAVGAGLLLFVVKPRVPPVVAAVGGVLGMICGVMQHLSFEQAMDSFTAASSLLEVRAAFKSTTWGSRYIRFLYFSKLVLIALSVFLSHEYLPGVAFGYVTGYLSLMFVREIITLRDSFVLWRLYSPVGAKSVAP